MSIYPINKITAEAQAAAVLHRNADDCNPYPDDTDAGRLFNSAFYTEATRLNKIAKGDIPDNIKACANWLEPAAIPRHDSAHSADDIGQSFATVTVSRWAL